jgi:hypothetical protein
MWVLFDLDKFMAWFGGSVAILFCGLAPAATLAVYYIRKRGLPR